MHIELSRLRFGHEAEPPINARRTGRMDGIEGYAASIAAHGLIQALNVRLIGGVPFVADGNKRLAALRLRAERNEINGDWPVKCDVDEAPAIDGEELSVAANFIRAPLHEADTYETFRDLSARGLTDDEIAARFGIEVARVRKMLALGRLSPVILDAWREGVFLGKAAECVRAFTLARDTAEQEKVYRQLAKDGQVHIDWKIREALGAADGVAQRNLKFVGKEAYVAAGGRLVEDLFGDGHVVYDTTLAATLVEDRFNTVVTELMTVDGWSWAERESAMPQGWSWNWQKLTPGGKPTRAEKKRLGQIDTLLERASTDEDTTARLANERAELQAAIEKRTWNDDEKAKAGCVVAMSIRGEMVITYGVLRPKAPEKAKAAEGEKPADGAKVEKEPVLSNALHHRLSIQATLALRAALERHPKVGLAALLAGFAAHRQSYTSSPVRVLHEGFGRQSSATQETFATVFERYVAMDEGDLLRAAAGVAAQALSLERGGGIGTPVFDPQAGPLAAELDPDMLVAALREQFQAQDYFASASKPIVVRAVGEAVNADEARKAEKLKKAELVDYAMANVVKTGWLPPELRPSTYTGPGADPRG